MYRDTAAKAIMSARREVRVARAAESYRVPAGLLWLDRSYNGC